VALRAGRRRARGGAASGGAAAAVAQQKKTKWSRGTSVCTFGKKDYLRLHSMLIRY